MIGAWAKASILYKVCVCTTNADKCPLGGNLQCLQKSSLQIQNIPHDCLEPLTKFCLESAKTIWEVAEIYAEDIFLTDIPSPALRHFLDCEKEKQSQR